MTGTYKMTIAGCERELPMYPVNDKLEIAAFILFDDVEITEKSAQALLRLCPEHDIILTAEAKSIPLCYELARIGCKRYVVARKGTKVYMTDPISASVNSITTSYDQMLYLGLEDVEKLRNKRVLILDDVISTGESLKVLENLVEKSGGTIVGKAAVLAEGDAANRDDIIFLEKLPLFFK
ncbi:MAG: phosphoribosyltransferase family protein [Eubacteriales bacterium]|nr:phosphoribosyltransferase family protein [Eubacteriales bacterium]